MKLENKVALIAEQLQELARQPKHSVLQELKWFWTARTEGKSSRLNYRCWH